MACFVFPILPGLVNASFTMTAAAEQPINLLDHPITRKMAGTEIKTLVEIVIYHLVQIGLALGS